MVKKKHGDKIIIINTQHAAIGHAPIMMGRAIFNPHTIIIPYTQPYQ